MEGTPPQMQKPEGSQVGSIHPQSQAQRPPEFTEAYGPTETEETEPVSNENLDLKAIVDKAIEKAEREAITSALNRTKWNRRKSAQQLGISYSSLLRRIAKYNLESE